MQTCSPLRLLLLRHFLKRNAENSLRHNIYTSLKIEYTKNCIDWSNITFFMTKIVTCTLSGRRLKCDMRNAHMYPLESSYTQSTRYKISHKTNFIGSFLK